MAPRTLLALFAFGAMPGAWADKPKHLIADAFVAYPTYTGNLEVSGSVHFDQSGSGAEAAQVMKYEFSGTDPECGTANITGIGNACGIHIHVGTNCSDAGTIGGHYWNETAYTTDPWKTVIYATVDGKASGSDVKVITGLSNEEVDGRVFVVHDVTGGRISCGPMKVDGGHAISGASAAAVANLILLVVAAVLLK